ncbi:hypothetical protein MMC26_002273 [Xylographa opegraphella]|nr:hypothetical protein [Xylographa opegraphella]
MEHQVWLTGLRVILARTTTRYGEDAAISRQRHSPPRRKYSPRRRALKVEHGMNPISAINAMAVTNEKVRNVGTQTMSMESSPMLPLTRRLRNDQYRPNSPRRIDNTSWRTRDVFDVPDSDTEHSRPLHTSMRVLAQSQPEKIDASTMTARNRRTRDVEDVGCAITKRRRHLLDELHLQNLEVRSPVMLADVLDNEITSATKHDIISISSDDDEVPALMVDRSRKGNIRPDHEPQLPVMKPLSTPRARAKTPEMPEMPEHKYFHLPTPSLNSSQFRTTGMKNELDPRSDAQHPETDVFLCRIKETTSEASMITRDKSHERTPDLFSMQAREFISSTSDWDDEALLWKPTLEKPSMMKDSENLMLDPDQSQKHQDLLDALTQEMRTPNSSIFEGYMPQNYGDLREQYSTAVINELPKQALELTAEVKTKNTRRSANQMNNTRKTMPEGYYEAISQHVRRPPAVLQKHVPSPSASGNAESSDTTSNETEGSGKEESKTLSLQDFKISGDTELELMNVSSAVQRIVRRMNRTIRRMTNDEY